jgi:hypothetical protein
MIKLPPYYELIKLYHADHPNCKFLRFGQWFIVNYAKEVVMPELFYEIDSSKAYKMILDKFYSAP